MKIPDPVVRVLSGYRLSPCSVNGTFPIYTEVIKNSKTLVNSETNTITITLNEEGNYTCLAKSKYGTDMKNFTVVFNGESFRTENCIFFLGHLSFNTGSYTLNGGGNMTSEVFYRSSEGNLKLIA